jgi:iduronate 2-sulfatase
MRLPSTTADIVATSGQTANSQGVKRDLCFTALAGFLIWSPLLHAATNRFNVLFIPVDDLRPELGCHGNKLIRSPTIDFIAARGMVFNRAYCQQALCSPRRSSLLTGLRPDTTKVYSPETHFLTNLPNVVALPQLFKQNGWHAQGLSKI